MRYEQTPQDVCGEATLLPEGLRTEAKETSRKLHSFSPCSCVCLHKKRFHDRESLKSCHHQSFFCAFLISLPLLFFVYSRLSHQISQTEIDLRNSPKFSAKSLIECEWLYF